MVLLTTIFLGTLIISTLPVTITSNEDTNGDTNGDINGDTNGDINGDINGDTNGDINGDINHAGVQNNAQDYSDLVHDINIDADNGGLSGHQLVDSVNGQIHLDDDFTVADDADVNINLGQIYDDGGATEQHQQQGTAVDEEVDTYVDEELQQDLPDVWSDTGQYLPGSLDDPIMIGPPSEAEAGECPPPAVLVTPSLCGAPACLTHRHCRDPETACCFNGCVHTCLRPLDAPAVIDWLEDTSLLLPMLDEAPDVPRFPVLFEGSSSIAYAQGGGEAVHLQGGCTITSQQYNQLKDFMTRTTIQDCSCTGGEVVCAVKPYKADAE